MASVARAKLPVSPPAPVTRADLNFARPQRSLVALTALAPLVRHSLARRRLWLVPVALAAPAEAVPRLAPDVVRELWVKGFDAERWSELLAEDCVYEDLYYAEPFRGREEVLKLLKEKLTASRWVVDSVSDGRESCAFTWHLEDDGVLGLRGLCYLRLQQGRIAYVRDLAEPVFKAGELTEKLLEALTKDQPPPERPPSGPPQNPKTAPEIVKYLYGDVQKSGGDAIRFYANDVVYEDMNYETPFVGKAAVEGFLARFQSIQGVTFNLEEVSDGEKSVGFTYTIEIKGQPRGIRGITFYQVNDQGKVCYVRDVPESAAKPPPVQRLARLLRPRLWRLQAAPATPPHC